MKFFSDTNLVNVFAAAVRVIHEQQWDSRDEANGLAMVAQFVLEAPGTRTALLTRLLERDPILLAELHTIYWAAGE